ncbi:MAG: hypothetical protein ACP5N1_05510 [Candidatus Woesearchaeota archaeon]
MADMAMVLKREIDYLCNRIDIGNHPLIYGDKDHATSLLKGIYDKLNLSERFSCTYHDASNINHPLDFFDPILKLKYGSHYDRLRKDSEMIKIYKNRDDLEISVNSISHLTHIVGEIRYFAKIPLKKKPLIFIDGIEELFFKMDYGHLNEKERGKLFNVNFMDRPMNNGFGDSLRILHQLGSASFCGVVRDTESIEFKATLGNYHYLFYSGNFMNYLVDED